jgi:hypothetical protein
MFVSSNHYVSANYDHESDPVRSMSSSPAPQVRVAALFAASGAVILVAAVAIQEFPPIPLLLAFMATNAFFEWRGVEVNDRLFFSGGAMISLTAGVVFGADSAILGMSLVAVTGSVQPRDWRERRWFQPAANFGQLIVSAAAGGLALSLLLPTATSGDVAVLVQTIGASLAAAVVMAALGSVQVSWIVRHAFGRTDVRPWSGMQSILAAYLAMGTVGGVLGAAYTRMGNESFPLLLAIFAIAHLAASSYADLREAHEATMRGFIKALEAKDMFTHGHTGRVAAFARLIGEELGWSADRLELIRWSALLHDVGTLAVPRDLLRNRDNLSDAEDRQVLESTETVEQVLAESEFLRPMMERAARRRVLFSQAPEDQITADAQVLAVAKQFDYVTSGKSHDAAVSQDVALANLRAESPYRYDPEIVAALATALEKEGMEYGAIELKQHLTREDFSKQAMYDR